MPPCRACFCCDSAALYMHICMYAYRCIQSAYAALFFTRSWQVVHRACTIGIVIARSLSRPGSIVACACILGLCCVPGTLI
ncbi:hypothetical protein EDB81DRAFT_776294 [Dactylonectria macrodidyma]|uniref:Uncharacterized protein n=1 Tax=Dactylonectria macrodidyma TaxID=307937 RepID=A0A9P9JHE1_9HYPO|nr:hypothetical protein EDB81DRAFT_776294 [Dactylonectria macrodidyma]